MPDKTQIFLEKLLKSLPNKDVANEASRPSDLFSQEDLEEGNIQRTTGQYQDVVDPPYDMDAMEYNIEDELDQIERGNSPQARNEIDDATDVLAGPPSDTNTSSAFQTLMEEPNPDVRMEMLIGLIPELTEDELAMVREMLMSKIDDTTVTPQGIQEAETGTFDKNPYPTPEPTMSTAPIPQMTPTPQQGLPNKELMGVPRQQPSPTPKRLR